MSTNTYFCTLKNVKKMFLSSSANKNMGHRWNKNCFTVSFVFVVPTVIKYFKNICPTPVLAKLHKMTRDHEIWCYHSLTDKRSNLIGDTGFPFLRSISRLLRANQRNWSLQLKAPQFSGIPCTYWKFSSLMTSMIGQTTLRLKYMWQDVILMFKWQ